MNLCWLRQEKNIWKPPSGVIQKRGAEKKKEMCEFISWKEMPDGSIWFLTEKMIYHTKRGGELRRHTTQEDWVGHGAIDFYYEDERFNGVQKECTDFSTPDNFPPEIVNAILAGEMALPGVKFPKGLLRGALYWEHEKKCNILLAVEYVKKCNILYAEHVKQSTPLAVEYVTQCDILYTEHVKKRNAMDLGQWELFKNPDNRAEAWCRKDNIRGREATNEGV